MRSTVRMNPAHIEARESITDEQRYLFDLRGYLAVENALIEHQRLVTDAPCSQQRASLGAANSDENGDRY